ncbi:hypothetical protein RCL1_005023 [Eukaryota sp. TZLM3-RCL]
MSRLIKQDRTVISFDATYLIPQNTLDLPLFRKYLLKLLAKKQSDPTFHHKYTVQQLRTKFSSQLSSLENEWSEALVQFKAAALSSEIINLEKEISLAISRKKPELYINSLHSQLNCLGKLVPEYQKYQESARKLTEFKQEIGLLHHEDSLSSIKQTIFQKIDYYIPKLYISDIISAFVVSDLVSINSKIQPNNLVVLQDVCIANVLLNFVLAEIFDFHGQSRVVVHAIIDVVNNPNDLGAIFEQRQSDLHYLTGTTQTIKISSKSATQAVKFNGEVEHFCDGQRFFFSRESFANFFVHSHHNLFVDQLYFLLPNKQFEIFDPNLSELICSKLINEVDIKNESSVSSLYKDISSKIGQNCLDSQSVLNLKHWTCPHELIFVE